MSYETTTPSLQAANGFLRRNDYHDLELSAGLSSRVTVSRGWRSIPSSRGSSIPTPCLRRSDPRRARGYDPGSAWSLHERQIFLKFQYLFGG